MRSKAETSTLAVLAMSLWIAPGRITAAELKPKDIGKATRASITRSFGTPYAEMHFTDGWIRVRWPRDVFSGTNLAGQRGIAIASFYDCDFGPDNVLRNFQYVPYAAESIGSWSDHKDVAELLPQITCLLNQTGATVTPPCAATWPPTKPVAAPSPSVVSTSAVPAMNNPVVGVSATPRRHPNLAAAQLLSQQAWQSIVAAQQDRHPNLAAAKLQSQRAWEAIAAAQRSNESDNETMAAHVQRAKDLLDQVNKELKLAAHVQNAKDLLDQVNKELKLAAQQMAISVPAAQSREMAPQSIAAGAPAAVANGNAQANGPAGTLVMNYLATAGTLDANATRAFLSADCKGDVVTEFQANGRAGWNFSAAETKLVGETTSVEEGKATVATQVVYKGGSPPSFMATAHTFFLVLQNGVWKISRIDPPPKTTGPGVIPLGKN